ncbi:unnamed protein product [Dracunculus medinensis]|uniref:Protein kish-B n=1 Tax=Dracunculus medinensis TaxID=318479 RepID=A0A3P7PQR1_DRAME|nr:unnamed protein product [Dracunculus medinensis]
MLICTCAYLKRIPRINCWITQEKKGFFGIFYKASVIGIRLHSVISLLCIATSCYILFIRYFKSSIPKGVKQNFKKNKPQGPKKGRRLAIAPKKAAAIEQARISVEVTRIINEKNEKIMKEKADSDIGRISNR